MQAQGSDWWRQSTQGYAEYAGLDCHRDFPYICKIKRGDRGHGHLFACGEFQGALAAGTANFPPDTGALRASG